MLPVVIGRQIEFAYAAGDAGSLFDAHQPFIFAQVLADLAAHAEQSAARPFNLVEHGFQRIFQYLWIVVQGIERFFLSLQFLQKIGFEVGAAGDFEDFEQDTECGMMICAVIAFDEAVDTEEEILQAQHGAHSFVERKLVADHIRLIETGFDWLRKI